MLFTWALAEMANTGAHTAWHWRAGAGDGGKTAPVPVYSNVRCNASCQSGRASPYSPHRRRQSSTE